MFQEIEGADETLSLDRIYTLLAARRRRYTLYCLYLSENPVSLPDIAEQMPMWEQNDGDVSADRQCLYNDLYHSHVPKLADADVIDYSPDDNMVALGENVDQLRPYLERAADRDLIATDTDTLTL